MANRPIAIDVRRGLSTLRNRILNKIRRLIPPVSVRVAAFGKTRVQTLGKRLGYGPQQRLVIVHADDLGVAHAVNTAFFRGLATGLINSGSVLVPCPWFSEVAVFAQAHPEADIGLQLTLTSESTKDRWAPVALRTQVPSLVDQQGNFLDKWTSETRIDPHEVEIELRAQIEKAYAAGLRPTHLDSHQHRLQLSGSEVFEVYLRLGREYHLPVRVSREWFSRFPYLQFSLTRRDVVLDRIVRIHGNVPSERWSTFYRRAIKQLPLGVTEFIIHPGYDDEELRRFFENCPARGAAWCQRDLDFFTSDEFRDLLGSYDIKLITWREITTRLQQQSRFARGRHIISLPSLGALRGKPERIGFKSLRTIRGGKDGSYVIGAMFTAPYSDKAERLAASCEKFGLQYVIHEVPTVHRSISNRGTEDLSYTKANFIRHLLAAHEKPVLYLDVDCEFVSQPDLIEELVSSGCDFAIYNTLAEEYEADRFFPIEVSPRPAEPPIRNRFYRWSGFVPWYANNQLICCGLVQFYRNSLAARELLSRWHKTIATFLGCADDACLDFVFNNLRRRSWLYWLLKVRWLPKPYARISWWIYAKPVINNPHLPGGGNDFREIADSKGRKRFYPSRMKLKTATLFPRDCIIDTEQHMVCRLVDGQLVPVEPIDQSFWL
jgi:chitin disaccharide deacetylase